jgi:hypothetical protein
MIIDNTKKEEKYFFPYAAHNIYFMAHAMVERNRTIKEKKDDGKNVFFLFLNARVDSAQSTLFIGFYSSYIHIKDK